MNYTLFASFFNSTTNPLGIGCKSCAFRCKGRLPYEGKNTPLEKYMRSALCSGLILDTRVCYTTSGLCLTPRLSAEIYLGRGWKVSPVMWPSIHCEAWVRKPLSWIYCFQEHLSIIILFVFWFHHSNQLL